MATCLTPPAASGELHDYFVWLLGMAVVAAYTAISEAVRRGNPRWAAAASFATSPLALLLAAEWEGRTLWQVMAPGRQAPVVLYGDTLLLPAIFALAAIVWRSIPEDSRWRSTAWRWLALSVGIEFAIWFHHGETKVYDLFRINSPSKLVHDFLAEPVLTGGLVFSLLAIVYILLTRWRELPTRTKWYAVTALTLFGVFVVLLAIGSGGVSPSELHPQWDWSNGGHILNCQPAR